MEELNDLIKLIGSTKEFSDTIVRQGDKKQLNLLTKDSKFRLWENSSYVSRQIDRIGKILVNDIGPALSQLLVSADLTTFERILKKHPREIELLTRLLTQSPCCRNI
ncbi:hypothetical protein MXB_1871 [Myxobolus squamalis]|nr:hypothetical protein MXB_1871 [Myxobolus squamalis]